MLYQELSIRVFLYTGHDGVAYCSVDNFYELRQLLKVLKSACSEVSVHFSYGSLRHVRRFRQ